MKYGFIEYLTYVCFYYFFGHCISGRGRGNGRGRGRGRGRGNGRGTLYITHIIHTTMLW